MNMGFVGSIIWFSQANITNLHVGPDHLRLVLPLVVVRISLDHSDDDDVALMTLCIALPYHRSTSVGSRAFYMLRCALFLPLGISHVRMID